RIAHAGFRAARKRKRKLCSVDKANVLETSQLWREVVSVVGEEYAEVELVHMYVDNAAMQLLKNPGQFDVIVTGNMFGDILSDEASMLTGSIGMLRSASLDEKGKGLYEPIHGSAPDIAGKNLANPLAAILSAAMMLRYSFDQDRVAVRVEGAVKKVSEIALMDIVISCQGGDYTNEMFPKLSASGWRGYWIDAASALRMQDDAVIILDPVNMNVIRDALSRGVRNYIGGNCTVSL